jgi:hypothetical protein
MASITIDDARYIIGNVYDTKTWKQRVRTMPDNQVLAIYYSFLEKGKFNKPKIHNSAREPVQVKEPEVYFQADTAEQLSFDI